LKRGLADDGYVFFLTPDTRRELGAALVEIGRLKRDLIAALNEAQAEPTNEASVRCWLRRWCAAPAMSVAAIAIEWR
jgi:hypothetical protein